MANFTNPYYSGMTQRLQPRLAVPSAPIGSPGMPGVAPENRYPLATPRVGAINLQTGAQLGGAAVDLVGSTIGAFQAPEEYKITSQGYSGTEDRPVYDLGDDFSAIKGYGEKQVSTTNRALSTAASYAGAGAALGSVLPGIGTVIGGIGGALVGGIVGLFGGRRAKRKAEQRKRRAYRQLLAKQEAFNQANVDYSTMAQQKAVALRSL